MAAPQNSVSVSRRPPDVEDYIDIMRRYRSWIIAPAFAGLVISVVASCWWPDTYACTAAMQIRPGAANDLLPSSGNKMQQRLQQLQLEILARDSLIGMIKDPKLDLYKKEQQRYPVEDIAEEMGRKHVKIFPISNEGDSHAQAFRIWFEYPDKYKAAAVVRHLMEEFTNKNLSAQTTEASSTNTLMEDLVRTAKEKMDRDSAELAAFTAENQSRLPMGMSGFGNAASDGGFGAVAANMEVTNITNQINGLADEIGREEQNQTILENGLVNIKQQQMQAENNLTVTQTVTDRSTVSNASLIKTDEEILKQKAFIEGLLRRYQPNFPDVLKAKDELHAMEQHRDDLEKAAGPAPTPANPTKVTVRNPEAERQLNALNVAEAEARSRIQVSKQAVELKKKRISDLSRHLDEIRDKITSSPPIIQKFNSLRDTMTMDKMEYEKLSQTKDNSDNSQQVTEHRAGDTLEILENPIVPETPTFPNRPAIIGMGTMMGLTLGIVLAAAKEIKNTSLKNLKDVRAYTNLPVLSSIPLLENALLVRRKRRLAWLAWSSAIIVGSILMCGAVYYHMVIAAQQVS